MSNAGDRDGNGQNDDFDDAPVYDSTTIYGSDFYSYRVYNLNNTLRNQTNFTESSLQLFTAYNLVDIPSWANLSNTASVFHAS